MDLPTKTSATRKRAASSWRTTTVLNQMVNQKEVRVAVRKFILLLALASVGCGDSPTKVILPPEPEPEDVTLTFTTPWPRNVGIPVEDAVITCLEGCPKSQILTTDSLGTVTFPEVFPPLKVEVRKPGYITQDVAFLINKSRVVISHVWPDEAEGTLDRLPIPKITILQWGMIEIGEDGFTGRYSCPTVVVKENSRKNMLHVMEHELFHAHQSYVMSGETCLITKKWIDDDEGKAYIEAWEEDKKEDRLFFPMDSIPHYQTPGENSAEFYAWWAGEGWDLNGEFDPEDLCIATARCQFMEDYFGPRPNGYP